MLVVLYIRGELHENIFENLIFDLCFYDALHSNGFCYNPGQRTIHLLGETLNSDKHPVHLVVTQTIDMREVLTAEAYAKLPTAQQKRTNVRNTTKPTASTPSASLLPMVTAR